MSVHFKKSENLNLELFFVYMDAIACNRIKRKLRILKKIKFYLE